LDHKKQRKALSGERMKKKKHKFQVGQLVRVKNTFNVAREIRNKYGYILALSINVDEPEYKIIIQGIPEDFYYVFQRQFEIIE
jgi:hypothetical protein